MSFEDMVNSSAELANKAIEATGDAVAKGAESLLGEDQYNKLQYQLGSLKDGLAYVQDAPANQDSVDTAIQVLSSEPDPMLLEDYLHRYEGPMKEEDQLKMNQLVERASDIHAMSNFKERQNAAVTYEMVNNRLPAAQAANLQKYEEGLEKGFFNNHVPEYLSGMPNDVLVKIAQENPKAFAETFPGSPLVNGTELNDLVERAASQLQGLKAKDVNLTLCGVARGSNLLKNPNLDGQQLYRLAKALTETTYNPNNPAAFENMNLVVMRILRHPKLGPQSKTLLIEHFPEGSISENTYSRLNS